MKELVQCPDATFRPVPWWCWTGELDMAEMDRQLRAMRAQGIREFIIFALYGLEFPFLGETWWQRIGWTLDRCEKLGLKVWIYDDYNWPSGTCAGRLLRDHPEVRAERFAIERVPVRPGERVVRDVADGWVGAFLDVPAGAARPLPAGAAPRGGRLAWTNRSRRPVSLVLVTRRPCAHAGVKSRGALWCEPQIGYLDTLNPKAVRLYRAAIHGEYEKRFRRYFGKTLVGFFTDEPQLSTSGGTYCSAALTDAFRKQYGYSLESHLHELLADAGQFPLTRYPLTDKVP